MSKPAILGGKPVRTKAFSLRRTMGEKEKKAVRDVMEADVLSAFLGAPGKYFLGGPHVKAFESAWAEKFGFKYAVSVNSLTSALIIAIGAIGVEPGDEIICTPYSMSASATCALFYGGVPVFADIDEETFCLDPKSIKNKITARTKAIVVVHLFGHPADMDEIMEIARSENIKVIEDAAQAPGALYKGRPVGAIGDIGGFSFNYHKHIHTGEGGMLVTNDDSLASRCQMIRNHGENAIENTSAEYLDNLIGGNFRLTEIQAAIGVEQIKRLDGYLKTRQALAGHMNTRLSEIAGLNVQIVGEGCTHAYYAYPFKYDEEITGLNRELFLKAVLAELPNSDKDTPYAYENIALGGGYVRPLYLNEIYQKKIALGREGFPFSINKNSVYDYSKGLCPVAERMHEKELITSPIVREPLKNEDMDDVANAIEKVIENTDVIRESFQ